MATKTISVIIPAFNEERKIGATVKALQNISEINEIVVINDGSTDRTGEVAYACGAKVIKMRRNRGKGDALNYGRRTISGDIVCILDADLGYSAREVVKLIEPVLHGVTDMTVATFPKTNHKGGFGLVKNLARYGIKLFTGKRVEAPLSGQRVMTKEVFKSIQKFDKKYGVEVGMTIDVLRKGYKLTEVPVNMSHNYTGRDLQGFIHRAGQFVNVLNVLMRRVITR